MRGRGAKKWRYPFERSMANNNNDSEFACHPAYLEGIIKVNKKAGHCPAQVPLC
jgi:hypothetical protein